MKNTLLNIILNILFIIHNSAWLQSAFYILIILLLSLPLFLSCFMLVKVVSCKKSTDDIITLEDDIKYNVVDKININNIEYLYLESLDNDFDFCIRKVLFEKGKEFISGIENENEFDMALLQKE